MKLIICVLLWFIFRHTEAARGRGTLAEIRAFPDIDCKTSLELARVYNVYSLPPPENQQPSNMEISKYCELSEVNYILYQQHEKMNCVAKTQETRCQQNVQPTAGAKSKSPCGRRAYIGRRYSVQYDVCLLDDNSSYIKQIDSVVLFSICYSQALKQPLYTEHTIASNSYNPQYLLDPQSYDKWFEKHYTYDMPQQLDNIAQAYQTMLLNPASNNFDVPNYLIPQTLLPPTDFEPKYARGAHLTWAAVRPQYARLSGAWNSLNKIIWQMFHNRKLKAKIYTGTDGDVFVKGEAVTLRVLENDDITSKILVPYIWWKAVKTNDEFFIVIFYNVPSQYPIRTIRSRCTDRENNPITEKHCTDILTKLEGTDGLYIECCSLTAAILRSMHLDPRHDLVLLNQPKPERASRSFC